MKLSLAIILLVALASGSVLAEKNSSVGVRGRSLIEERKGKKGKKMKDKEDDDDDSEEDMMPPALRMLQILHSSDNESAFQDPNTLEEKIVGYSAVANGLEALAAAEGIPSIHVTAGDHTLPGPFYGASAEVPSLGKPGLADIAMFNAMGLTANGMGNHEFDGGINDFAEMLAIAEYPFLAANLDFSGVQLAEGTSPIMIGDDAEECSEIKGMVAKSCYVDVTPSMKVGLVGRAPADFFNLIEDPETNLPGLDFVGGRSESNVPLVSAVGQVQSEIDALTAAGADIIILLDHAQDFTGDPLLVAELAGVDIIIAAGATGFLLSPFVIGPHNLPREGDVGENLYPSFGRDMGGNLVLLLDSDQLYNYVGNLIVTFDAAGNVVTFDGRSGPVATSNAAMLAGAVPDPVVVATLAQLQATPSITDGFGVVGTTAFPLNGFRADIRSKETNLGRLVSDSTIWGGNQFASANGLPAVDVALKNGGGIRASITGPSMIRLTLRAALAFNNKLAIVELTAAGLLATMENAVSRAANTDGRFPQVAGMTLVYDLAQPGVEGGVTSETPSRVVSLVVTKADGTEDVVVSGGVFMGDATRTFVMATNSFLITGGDGYASLAASNQIGETDIGEQQILEDYIVTVLGGSVDIPEPPASPRVSLA